MINSTGKIKEIFERIQKKLFYIVPEKWKEIYLYASIIEKFGNVEIGEMYFYYMPKGILKRKFVNVYEIPNKYNIEEDEYLKLVEQLYDEIKNLREEFRNTNKKAWSNVTISIKNNKIKYEFYYDNLLGGQEEYFNHHVYWRKKYLNIEPCGKKEQAALKKYVVDSNTTTLKKEELVENIYKK